MGRYYDLILAGNPRRASGVRLVRRVEDRPHSGGIEPGAPAGLPTHLWPGMS